MSPGERWAASNMPVMERTYWIAKKTKATALYGRLIKTPLRMKRGLRKEESGEREIYVKRVSGEGWGRTGATDAAAAMPTGMITHLLIINHAARDANEEGLKEPCISLKLGSVASAERGLAALIAK